MVHGAVMLLAQCAVSGKDVSAHIMHSVLDVTKWWVRFLFCVPGSSGTVCLFIIIFALNHNVEF